MGDYINIYDEPEIQEYFNDDNYGQDIPYDGNRLCFVIKTLDTESKEPVVTKFEKFLTNSILKDTVFESLDFEDGRAIMCSYIFLVQKISKIDFYKTLTKISTTLKYRMFMIFGCGEKLMPLFVNVKNNISAEDSNVLYDLLIDYLQAGNNGYVETKDIEKALSFDIDYEFSKKETEVINRTLLDSLSIRPEFLTEPLPILANALLNLNFRIKCCDSAEMVSYENYLGLDSQKDNNGQTILMSKILGRYSSSKKEIQICPSLITQVAQDLFFVDCDNDRTRDALIRKVLLHELSHLILDASIEYNHFAGFQRKSIEGSYCNGIELHAIEESLANYLCLWYCAKIYGTDSDTFRVADYFIRNCQPLMYKFGTEQYSAHVDWTKWSEKKNGTFSSQFLHKAKEWYDEFVVGNKPYTANDYNLLFND